MRRLALFLVPLALAACGHERRTETETTVTKDGVTTTTRTVRTGRNADAHADARAETDVAATTVSGLDIDTDKFKASLQVPGLHLSSDDMDLDGMKLYPGSAIKGMRVKATDRDGDKRGTATMDFTSPAAPATVAAHMVDQAKKAGFTVASSSAAGLTATRADGDGDNRFTVTLNPNGDATVGQMTMTGFKND